MNPTDRERVKDLLAQAARLEPAKRRAFIESAAKGNGEIAAEAIELLHTLDDSVFMSAPTGAGFAEKSASVAFIGEGPGAKIGRYKLLQLVGEGGFGSVFMAEQTEPVHRRVALKIIKAGMDTKQVIARFEAERQALAMMDHPNIARVFDAGATDAGRPYFVMELVRGEPVTRYCDRERLPVRQRLELFRDVCNAVQHAHQKGIIHRDLKPSNVMVTVADGAPLPKVIDFGIAKATATRLTDKTLFTEMHQLIGTPEYMSPEQAEVSGVDIDTRSDVYALGVLLYELLAGSTPLEHGRLRSTPLAEIQRLIREEEPPRPSLRLATLASASGTGRFQTPTFVAGDSADSSAMEIARCRHSEPLMLAKALRGDLDWIVMKCLEKDRRRRYATASALADDITRYLANQPVLATPPSTRYKLSKFVARNRMMVLSGATIAALLVLGVIGTTLGLVWALRAQNQTQQQRIIAEQNAANAQSEAQRANDEADQTRAVIEFMREVLTCPVPQKQGVDVRLIDVLAGASASAEERFAGHPLQEAEVHEMLGAVYENLGRWSDAEVELDKATALWKQHGDPQDPRALSAEAKHAILAVNLWWGDVAEEIVAGLIPRLEHAYGPDDPRTLSARVTRALADVSRHRLNDAEPVLLELQSHPRLENDDIVQVRILRGLIVVARRRTHAVPRAEWKSIFARAEPLALEWVQRATRRFGADSLVTFSARLALLEITSAKGEYQAAVDMCRAFLEQTAESLGDCHDLRTTARVELSEALAKMGYVEEPAELRLRAVECRRIENSATHLLIELSDALRYLERARRPTEGETMARELTGALRQLGGGHGDVLFESELYVARFVSMQGRLDEAEETYQSLFAREKEANRFARARLRLFYSGQLVQRSLFEEAERQLLAAVELIDDLRLGTLDSHPDDVILAFIELYGSWGKQDKAKEFHELRGEFVLSDRR